MVVWVVVVSGVKVNVLLLVDVSLEGVRQRPQVDVKVSPDLCEMMLIDFRRGTIVAHV